MEEIIAKTRELCKLLQSDESFKKYIAAKEVNDNDEQLQEDIGAFNLAKMAIDNALGEEERDDEKVKALNEDLRKAYSKIMVNENMQYYQAVKQQLDKLVNDITSLIVICANGEDPDTAEIPSSCGGDCASCGGCH